MINDNKKTKNRTYWKKTLFWMFFLAVIIEGSCFLFLKTAAPITFKTIIFTFSCALALSFILIGIVQSLHGDFVDFKKSNTKGKIAIVIMLIAFIVIMILRFKQIAIKYK